MWHRWVPYLLAVVVGVLAVWTFWPRHAPEVGKSAPLPPAREVRSVERLPAEVRVAYVYPAKTKDALDLPAPVAADPAKAVMATGKLDAQERPYTLSAVIDTKTGQSEVYARPDPLPWLGSGRRGAAGIAYGLGDDGPTAKAYAYHDLLQVKALHAGARAEVDQHGEYWAGGYVEYRW